MLGRGEIAGRLFGHKLHYPDDEWEEAGQVFELVKREQELRREMYQLYLHSPQWQAKRKAILKRDKYKCKFCGKKGNQVHHLTYVRIFNELPYDLVTTCNGCHKLLHKIEQKRS